MNEGTLDWQFVVLVCSLGYERYHQQNLDTLRGAKSNALFLRGAHRQAGCPCVALVSKLLYIVLHDERKG
jgi:hypothetical protein